MPPCPQGGEHPDRHRHDRVDDPQVGEEVLLAGEVEGDEVLREERVGEGGHRPGGPDEEHADAHRHDGEPKLGPRPEAEPAAAGQPEDGEREPGQQHQRVDEVEGNGDRPGDGGIVGHPLVEHDGGADRRLPENGDPRHDRPPPGGVPGGHRAEHPPDQDRHENQRDPGRGPVGEFDGGGPFQVREYGSLTGRPRPPTPGSGAGGAHQCAEKDHADVDAERRPGERSQPSHFGEVTTGRSNGSIGRRRRRPRRRPAPDRRGRSR